MTHWYTNKWLIDWLLDWSNGKSSMIPNPIQFNRVWSNSSLVAVINQLFSLFIVYSELFLFNEAKSMSYFNLNDCIALSTCLQGIHKWNNHQISIHLNHSIVSLSNPIFLTVRSNQFAIIIEQILAPSYSNHYLVIIGRLQSSSLMNIQ